MACVERRTFNLSTAELREEEKNEGAKPVRCGTKRLHEKST